ncbi:unnamed protein product [Anisakis simplex]|uniref:DUF1768 domain-containing protein n=1 Tax=Anisakis simplex TaxID=6269 RepID=A0A0M3K3Q9_ANISI|nr:unnamed protein product [Anisakis simplex]
MTSIVTAPDGARFTLFFSIRSPFSNFHPCRMTIIDQNEDSNYTTIFFNSTEQYYMYHKAISFGDLEIADQILREREARKIKALGRKVKNFDANKWNDICEDVMRRGNTEKYTQNDELRKKLFCTHGSTLVECSPNDKIWGIGMSIFDPNAVDPSKWRGQNKLGHILTRIREDLWKKPEYAQEVNEIVGMLKNFDVIACRLFPPPKAPQRPIISQSPSPFIPTSTPSNNSPFLPTDTTQMMMFATPIQAQSPFSIPLPPETRPKSPNAADYTKSSPIPESFYCFEKDQSKTLNNIIPPASIENSTKIEDELSYEEEKRSARRNGKKGDEQHVLMSKDDSSYRYAHQQQQYPHSAPRRGRNPEPKRRRFEGADDGEPKRPPSTSSFHHYHNLRSHHYKRSRRSASYSSSMSSSISSESRSRSRSGSRRKTRKESDDTGRRRWRRNEYESRRRRKSSVDDESRYMSSKQRYDSRTNGRSGNRNLSDSDGVASADIRHSQRRRHQRRRMHSATSSSSTSDSCAGRRSPKRNNHSKRSRLTSTESKQSLNGNATNENTERRVEEDDVRHGDEFTSLLQKLREKPSGLWEKRNTSENAMFVCQ